MTNKERILKRIERSKKKRQEKKEEYMNDYDNFDKVFSYQHFYDALRKCLKGVSWKASVQLYFQRSVELISDTYNMLHSGKLPKLKRTLSIVLYERGKRRIITPIRIEDRMTQRVLCDYALVPAISRKLIFDNGASMKDKGVHFTRKRAEHHIREAMSEYGDNFYVLTYDFKSFFDSISHKECLRILNELFTDKRLVGITMAIIKSYQISEAERIKDEKLRKETLYKLRNNEGVGICLGSQVSQSMALIIPNDLDHFIKDAKGVKHYVRYMDDGFILSDDKEFLMQLFEEMQLVAQKLGLTFNTKKTRIVKMTKGFVFLKVRYRVKDGKLIKTVVKDGTTRMRRKLKKFVFLVEDGKMSKDDVFCSVQSWLGHSRYAMTHKITKRMLGLYNELFDGYRITKAWRRKQGELYEILQDNKRESLRWGWNDKRPKKMAA